MDEGESTVEVLIRKGKRAAACYLQSQCQPARQLNELLDAILDPLKPIDMWDTVDWCRWLMAGGKTPDEFANTVRRYNNATTCGLVWTANFVAYRCRTCGISPCMSLCADCFRLGNHEGHDFNMFRSQAGGACDCGDPNVMKAAGFCSHHGPSTVRSQQAGSSNAAVPTAPPPELLSIAQLMMPRLIMRLLQHLRASCSMPSGDTREEQSLQISRADQFLEMLQNLSALGAPMRLVMTQTLTNPLTYQQLTRERNENYESAKQSLKNWDCQMYTEVRALKPSLVHETFLEELVFWMAKYEFPQKLTCLLLSMLPEHEYKLQFTRTFVDHYPRISYMLTQCQDSETLSNRVVHVSVQLFSNEGLSLQLVHEAQLLHVMVISMKAMMKKILLQSTLQDPDKNLHYVINCGHQITKQHCYWPLVSDLNNILTHKRVVLEFLRDTNLLDVWFRLLSMYQGMNVHHRETERHVEFEPSTYYAAFSAELEASATPMWAFLQPLTDEETISLSVSVLRQCSLALEDFFDMIGFGDGDRPKPDQVTFHLPLHRYLATFLRNAVFSQGCALDDLLVKASMEEKPFLECLMAHPLQTIVSFYEIMVANMWVRNGLQMKGQAMTYIQSHFCNSMVDPDIFLLQLCATRLNINWYLSTIIERFRVGPALTLAADPPTSSDAGGTGGGPDEKQLAMLHSLLTFLATLLSVRTMLGGSEDECTREEMVSLLCMSDRKHSQLIDLLPEKSGQYGVSMANLERHMSAVADYKAPNFELGGHMIQGTYTPKPIVWQTMFDPIHTLLRSVHRKDYQAALDRFAAHTGVKNCWPPYRIPSGVHERFEDPRKLLFCSTLYGLIFVILHKAVGGSEEISEQILSLAVYLLEMAVEFHSKDTCTRCASCEGSLIADNKELEVDEVSDGAEHFSFWYPTGCPIVASLTLIKSVELANTADDTSDATSTVLRNTSSSMELDVVTEVAVSREAEPVDVCPDIVRAALRNMAGLMSLEQHHPQQRQLQEQNQAGSSSNSGSSSRSLSTAPRPRPWDMELNDERTQYALLPRRPREMLPASLRNLNRMVQSAICAMETDDNELDLEEDATMASLPALAAHLQLIAVNESIISLLLKLHHKLGSDAKSRSEQGQRRSVYRTPQELGQVSVPSCRIGDGVHFIGLLLDRFCLSHASVEARVRAVRDSLWPTETIGGARAAAVECAEQQQREERRRRAKERQQKLMQEFANQQRSFMKKCGEMLNDDKEAATDKDKEGTLHHSDEFECVICSQTSASTVDRPIAMVVLLQASSVLGHARPADEAILNLPCSDLEILPSIFPCRSSRGSYSSQRLDELARYFATSSLYHSANIGWEGGVVVQTCGHYLHVDCHKSYMLSQRSQQQDSGRAQQTLAPDRGEYLCPLCRQLANSVLPVHPSTGNHQTIVQCQSRTHRNVATEISGLMACLPTPPSGILSLMSSFIEDLTNAIFVEYHTLGNRRMTYPFSLIVCSVARTNLEIDLLHQGGKLAGAVAPPGTSVAATAASPPKKSCFAPLFHALGLNLKRALTDTSQARLWHSLTGLPDEKTSCEVTPVTQDVPFLIRDITAVLIELLLSLPLNLDKAYFTCVVRVLYSLAVTQAVCRATCRISREDRLELRARLEGEKSSSYSQLIGIIIDTLEKVSLYAYEEEEQGLDGHSFESYVERSVMPFLRIAAILEAHLFSEQLPGPSDRPELDVLANFLGLSSALPNTASKLSKPMETGPSTAAGTPFPAGASNTNVLKLVQWVSDPDLLVYTWCLEIGEFLERSRSSARFLLVDQPLAWRQPYLLRLPRNYSTLFEYYHKRACTVCQNVPQDPSVCLACGTIVCLREGCCRRQETSNFEAVQHSIECGAGTAVMLAVYSTSIIVIRGKRACLWGSVYLDSFGEEDRDLKRGKPLYLSEDRYGLLQHQWMTHSFDHCAHKRWVWHKDNL